MTSYGAIWRRKEIEDNAGVYHAHAHLWEAGDLVFTAYPLAPESIAELTVAEAHTTKRLAHVRLCMLPIRGPKPQWTRLKELSHLKLCPDCWLRMEYWDDVRNALEAHR